MVYLSKFAESGQEISQDILVTIDIRLKAFRASNFFQHLSEGQANFFCNFHPFHATFFILSKWKIVTFFSMVHAQTLAMRLVKW